MLRMVTADTQAGVRAITRLRAMLISGEGLVPKSVRARSKSIFGKDLSPADSVALILDDIRKRGDRALIRWTKRLDSATLTLDTIRVTSDEVAAAWKSVPASFRRAFRNAIANVTRYQRAILPRTPPKLRGAGVSLSLNLLPLARVGIYAPASIYAYPSTLAMTVVPAHVAGVEEIAVASPPGPTGAMNPYVLAACKALGVTEVYRLGGPMAIGALAFGTDTVPAVDKICGPGSAFVAAAKRAVRGIVDVDMDAGPSEVVIVADASAPAGLVAADLLAQSEHSPGVGILITTSRAFATRVDKEIERQSAALATRRQATEFIRRCGLAVVVKGINKAVDLANEFAPEHLQIMTKNAARLASRFPNAGTVFVGASTPTAMGDYYAGPSHVLPTGGTARFASGLSVYDFLRRQSVVGYSAAATRRAADDVIALAEAEGLAGHAESVRRRKERKS